MKNRIFFILSGMIFLIAGIPAVEARDSTGTRPPVARPGVVTFLAAGVAPSIYSRVPIPPVPFDTVPASTRCPDDTYPSITVSVAGLSGYPAPLASTQHFRYIALNCSTSLDANYKATCTNAFGVWAKDDGSGGVSSGLNIAWTIYCIPD